MTAPSLHREVEVKLVAGAAFTVPNLAGLTGVAALSEPVIYELDATYYDTQALDLLHSRITLRRREGGKDAGWHLKLPGSPVGSMWSTTPARTELGVPLSEDPPVELTDLLRGVTRGAPVQPVARIRTRRTVLELLGADGDPLVEVADDAVHTEVSDHVGHAVAASGPVAWRELEVELVSGPEDTVHLAAERLTKAGANPAPLPSKLAAALTAAGRGSTRGSGPSAAGTTNGAAFTRRSRAQDVVVAAIGRYRDALVSGDLGMRRRTSEGLHASRAAARRLRSALTVYRAMFDVDEVDRILKSLKVMDRALRLVRDNDILLARLTAEIAEEPAEFAAPAETLLRQALEDRNVEAWQRVDHWLQRKQSVRLIQRLDAFVANPPLDHSQRGTAGRLLPSMVAAAWTRVNRLADAALADPEDDEALERVRRAAKSVRYAAELAGTALGDDPVVFAAAVEEIQEVLGEHQNALIVGRFLVELAADPRTNGTAGFLYGRLHALADSTVVTSVDDFAYAWDRAEDGELVGWLR